MALNALQLNPTKNSPPKMFFVRYSTFIFLTFLLLFFAQTPSALHSEQDFGSFEKALADVCPAETNMSTEQT